MKYRTEIDGLRAIAVLPVLFFHAKITGFSGGFYGVDIFFVISGYLITSIILDEVRQDNFSTINFYERRARRILPALSFVLFCTTVAAFYYMPQTLFQEYQQSVAYVSTFTSNIFFSMQSGYFANPTDEMPLMHTWSLAIEEQYYVFFPLLVALIWKFARTYLLSVIFLFAVASLLYSQHLSDLGEFDANFYFIFSRAWELLLGSVIAFIPTEKIRLKGLKREFWSLLGFLMICYSITMFDEGAPLPLATLVPVIGSCLIIIFGSPATLVGRFLSTKILVFIGLISYSLYLWHQPLFALIRVRTFGEPSIAAFGVAILASIALATFSWKFIETPFRNKKLITRTTIFKFSAVSIPLFFLIGMSGFYQNDRGPVLESSAPQIASDTNENITENTPLTDDPFDDTIEEPEFVAEDFIESDIETISEPEQPLGNVHETDQTAIDQDLFEVRQYLRQTRVVSDPSSADSYFREYDQNDYFEYCLTENWNYTRPRNACRYFEGTNVSWAIVGDSHANSLGVALAERLQRSGQGLLHLTFNGCSPALMYVSSNGGCDAWTGDVVSYLESDDQIQNVVLTYNHSRYILGDHVYDYPDLPTEDVRRAMSREYDDMDVNYLRELYWQSFSTIVTRLLSAGKTVHITLPIPVLPEDIYKDYLFDIQKGAPYEYYLARNEFILQKLATLPFSDKLKAVNTPSILCNGISCPAVQNNRLLYIDDNHLNIYGASLVVDEIFSN